MSKDIREKGKSFFSITQFEKEYLPNMVAKREKEENLKKGIFLPHQQ